MPQRTSFIFAAVLTGLLSSVPAQSHLRSLQPREFAAYGPIEICSGQFNLIAGPGEALHVSGDIARVISDDRILAVKFANDRAWFAGEGPRETGRKAAGFAVQRFSGTVPDAGDTVRSAPEGLVNPSVLYSLSTRTGAAEIIVGATGFDGTDRDKQLLQRIKPGDTRSPGCVSLWHAISGVEDLNPDRGKQENLADIAEVYAPEPVSGPAFHCVGGIGFRVEAGENLLRPWRVLTSAGPLYLESAGTRIMIEERGGALTRYNEDNSEEHPMALVHDSSAYFFPGLGVQPLEGDTLVRREATWRFDLGVRSHSVALSVSFPAAKASAGMALLERLEFVKQDDVRCAAPSKTADH